MYIISKITYTGLAMRTQILNSNWKKIETIQHLAIKTIIGLPWYAQNSTILNLVNISTIKD